LHTSGHARGFAMRQVYQAQCRSTRKHHDEWTRVVRRGMLFARFV
jgi:hypothetical protein